MNDLTLSSRIGRDRLDRMLQSWIDESPDRKLQDEIERLFADHYLSMADAGIVRRYDLLPNRRMNLVHSWNRMFDQDPQIRADGAIQVVRRISHPMLLVHLALLAFDLRGKTSDTPDRETALDRISQKIDAGDAPWFLIGGHEQDFVSGEELAYEIIGWNLVIGRQGADVRRQGLEPVEDVAPVALHEIEIDLPTGHLLISDWFRAEGFTDLVDEGQPWRGGSQIEDERDAERYVRDHGFVSVRSIRRSLCVLTDGRTVTIGRHDEDGEHPLPSGFRRVGDFLIDLRKVSLVDRASLLGTLGRIHDASRARELVGEVEKAWGTIALEVPAGRYRIASSGRGYIEDLLEDGHPLKVPGYEPVMIIEKV